MLNILEGYDIGALGFGSADTLHLLAEVLKIAFADRAAATADPAFVKVPVEKLLSKAYAADRRARIDLGRAQTWSAEVAPGEGAHTTHLTVADGMGNIVASTQTINSLFGARYIVPGTGMIPNNYMFVFTPHPGRVNSVAPGKRITSSMSPVMVLKDGKPRYALGLPGGLRIFPSVMQAISNLIDHGMSVQEAVEAPRLWTQGFGVEVENSVPSDVLSALRDRGHDVAATGNVGGGMSAIQFDADGAMTGAACWRADGTPIGLGGGYARKGVRFRPEAPSHREWRRRRTGPHFLRFGRSAILISQRNSVCTLGNSVSNCLLACLPFRPSGRVRPWGSGCPFVWVPKTCAQRSRHGRAHSARRCRTRTGRSAGTCRRSETRC